MPIQPPSDRTHAKGGPPVFNPGLAAGDPPATQKNETNPIYPPQDPNIRNEPNLPRPRLPDRRPHPPNMRNEPNYRTAAPLFTIHRSLFTIFTKRTQFRPPTARATTQKCETNPIYPTIYSPQYTIYNPLTQFPQASDFSPICARANAKRTQSGYHTCPYCAKRTQSPHRRHPAGLTVPPIMRNEPNLPYPWRLAGIPSPHYAKRTQFTCRPRTAGIWRAPITQNEPNLPYRWRLAGIPIPHYAKPTQSPARRPKYQRLRTKC